MRFRLHHLFVLLGIGTGVIVAMFIQTEPRYVGWLFAVGAGLAGGAFFAAIVSGEPLAGGPAPRNGRRGAPAHPAWFDEPDEDDQTPPAGGDAPR